MKIIFEWNTDFTPTNWIVLRFFFFFFFFFFNFSQSYNSWKYRQFFHSHTREWKIVDIFKLLQACKKKSCNNLTEFVLKRGAFLLNVLYDIFFPGNHNSLKYRRYFIECTNTLATTCVLYYPRVILSRNNRLYVRRVCPARWCALSWFYSRSREPACRVLI